jgi:hypothetical protein
MDQSEKTELEELKVQARKLGMKLPTGIPNLDKFRQEVNDRRLEFQIRKEEEVRAKIKAEAVIKQRVADVQAEAEISRVKITIPSEPTLADVVKLEKKLKMKIKEPKPSIETLAIEASKKVYATFRNMEENSKDVDIVSKPGGKYRFECWPGKKHVIPEWLIEYHRKQCVNSIVKNVKNAEGNEIPTVVGYEERFLWQVHGDAPADAPFGVCPIVAEAG